MTNYATLPLKDANNLIQQAVVSQVRFKDWLKTISTSFLISSRNNPTYYSIKQYVDSNLV